MDKEKADKEYLDKFLEDIEKLKNEKILITAKVKTGEVKIKPKKAVEVYCIDSQGNKRTLEEIHSVFSGSISYKAENEKRKKLREDIEQAFDVVSDETEKAKNEKECLVEELVKLYKSLNLTPEEVRERNERNRAKFNHIMELITAQVNERYNKW